MTTETRVIVLGTCVVDLISYAERFPKPGETLIGDNFMKGFGGKGANQCVMSCRLGAPTTLVAKVGKDSFGKEYLEHLKNNNVKIDYLFLTDKSGTSTANICVTSKGENSIIYTPGAANFLTAEEIRVAEESLFRKSGAELLVCTFECPRTTLIEALTLAKKNKLKTLVNAAPVSDITLKDICHLTDILCMNEVETSYLTKVNVDSVHSAKEVAISLIKENFETVIITLGEKGVVLCTQGKPDPVHVEAEKVQTVDTTGAGDAFVGSLAYYLTMHKSIPLQEAIVRSSKIAAVSVQAHGTQSSYPQRNSLDSALFA